MNPTSFKASPQKKYCRSCKYFDINLFMIALQEKLKHLNNALIAFNSVFTNL